MKQFENHQDHMAARKGSIGSSEIGTILGLNKYQTPLDLWRLKTGRAEPFAGNQFTKMGNKLEGIVAELFDEANQIEIVRGSEKMEIRFHSDKPYFSASPDRYYMKDGEVCILECKTTQRDIDPDDLPLMWFSQLQWQLGICGIKKGSVAWLTRGVDFGFVDVNFDADYFSFMMEKAEDFWVNYVLSDVEPDPINAEDVIKLHPAEKQGKVIVASDELSEVLDELKAIKVDMGQLAKREKELKQQIQLIMKDAEAIKYMDETVATWKKSKDSQSFDSKAFKADHPKLYKQYLQTKPGSRRFLVK